MRARRIMAALGAGTASPWAWSVLVQSVRSFPSTGPSEEDFVEAFYDECGDHLKYADDDTKIKRFAAWFARRRPCAWDILLWSYVRQYRDDFRLAFARGAVSYLFAELERLGANVDPDEARRELAHELRDGGRADVAARAVARRLAERSRRAIRLDVEDLVAARVAALLSRDLRRYDSVLRYGAR